MYNNIFPFLVQAAAQSATESSIMSPFASASAMIEDEIVLLLMGY